MYDKIYIYISRLLSCFSTSTMSSSAITKKEGYRYIGNREDRECPNLPNLPNLPNYLKIIYVCYEKELVDKAFV